MLKNRPSCFRGPKIDTRERKHTNDKRGEGGEHEDKGQRQNKTRQDKTRRDKTRQDKTRQDKTRQDKKPRTQEKTRQD